MTLRVNLYGNVCNNLYVLAKFLRRVGVDAQLFVERTFAWLPEHEDPDLAGRYPDWIHVTGDLRWRRYGLFDGAFVKRLADGDVVHTSSYGPIWARQTGRPFVFQTYGGDLRNLPFMTDSLHHRYLARRQARAIQRADVVLTNNPHLMHDAVRRLRLRRIEAMPLPIDAEKFRPLADAEVRDIRRRHDGDWLFFHPTRQSWTRGDAADTWKGNDRVFRAFARFLKGGARRATLLAVRHGPDARASQELVRELGIEPSVRWLPPLRRHELVALYGAADLVLDQFARGGYGGIALEGWACGKPVLIGLEDRSEFQDDPPPAVCVRTEDEIHDALVDLSASPERRTEIGARARAWILRHHHGDAVIKRYVACYESLLAT